MQSPAIARVFFQPSVAGGRPQPPQRASLRSLATPSHTPPYHRTPPDRAVGTFLTGPAVSPVRPGYSVRPLRASASPEWTRTVDVSMAASRG